MADEMAQWPDGEVSDLLEAGPVGLYEFVWLLRTQPPHWPTEKMVETASRGLEHLLTQGHVRLVRLNRPPGVTSESPEVTRWTSADFSDIGEDGRYLAVELR